MFGKVKKWLGIEGVKVEIHAPEEVREKTSVIEGQLRFMSMNTQTVTYIKMTLVEKYFRGRGTEKLIDEYKISSIEMEEEFEVPADEILEVDFALPFELIKSDMDQFGDRNFLFKGIAKGAKYLQAAKSEYRIEVEAKVKGVALDPIDQKKIKIK